MKIIAQCKKAAKAIWNALTNVSGNEEQSKQIDSIVSDVGGLNNIDSVFACASRLRLKLKTTSLINQSSLKQNGALGVVVLDEYHAQIIYGPKANMYAQMIEEQL